MPKERRRYTRGPMTERMVEALERAGVRGAFTATGRDWELEYLARVCEKMERIDKVLDELRRSYDEGRV